MFVNFETAVLPPLMFFYFIVSDLGVQGSKAGTLKH